MNRYFSIMLLILLMFLVGCSEKVEQHTLTCTEQNGEEFILVFQDNRLISITSEDEEYNRFDHYDEILLIEEFVFDATDSDTVEEYAEYVEGVAEEEGTTCATTTEKVEYVVDPEPSDENTFAENMAKDSVMADVLAIEQASRLYCTQTTCDENQELTWTQIQEYIEGIPVENYDFTNNSGIVSTLVNGKWTVDLEAAGIGEWEFTQGLVPSECDRTCVIVDID